MITTKFEQQEQNFDRLMEIIIGSRDFAVDNFHSFKRIIPGLKLSAPQRDALNNPLTGVHRANEQGISILMSPEPLVLEKVPDRIGFQVDALRVFFIEILPLIINRFPFLAELLLIDLSELNNLGFDFEQRFDAILKSNGEVVIIDENSMEAGMPHLGPRLEFLEKCDEFQGLKGLDMEGFAQDLMHKFKLLEKESGVQGEGPIVFVTSSSRNSMSTTRNFEIEKLKEQGINLVELSAQDILNLEKDPFSAGFINIKGVRSNRVVNLLTSGGFMADPEMKSRISGFIKRMNSEQDLLLLNRLGKAGKTMMSRKIDLSLVSLPLVQDLIRELKGEEFLKLLMETLPNRRMLIFTEDRRNIRLSIVTNINAEGLVFTEIFNGKPGSFCRNLGSIGLEHTFVKDPFGSGGRGIVHMSSKIDKGTAGHILQFFREHGLNSNTGRVFVVEDEIPSATINAIDPLRTAMSGEIVRSGFIPRFEIFHSTSPDKSRVLGLSATLSNKLKVQAGAQACILPILTLK